MQTDVANELCHSEYAARNTNPILEVLQSEFAGVSEVLEIGSGTGQHAASFAAAMPHVQWQTSDLLHNHVAIQARVAAVGLDNLLPPLQLDVLTDSIDSGSYDGIYSANTAHIMSAVGAERMIELAAAALLPEGVFVLYGPFRYQGHFNAPSNEAFDESLRMADSRMGIRDIECLQSRAIEQGLDWRAWYSMPANNYCAVWEKKTQ